MFISPPASSEEMQSYDLAYLLEGSFTSYFKGKPIPEKINDKPIGEEDISQNEAEDNQASKPADAKPFTELSAQNTFLETSKPVKLFILPCSQMLQDNMLDPEGRSTNSTFLLNAIDHLNNEDKIAQLRSKQQTMNPLAETTPFDRGLIKAFNMIALPILVILFGLGVFAKRSSRKKKIAERFNA